MRVHHLKLTNATLGDAALHFCVPSVSKNLICAILLAKSLSEILIVLNRDFVCWWWKDLALQKQPY